MSPRASAATAEMPIPTGPEPSTATHSCSAEYFSSETTLLMCFSFDGLGLLGALVERQLDDFEALCFAAKVDVQDSAHFGVLDVDIRHRHRVAEGGGGLAGGDLADQRAVLEDRVVAAGGAPAQALEAHELLAHGGTDAGRLERGQRLPAHEIAFLGQRNHRTQPRRIG